MKNLLLPFFLLLLIFSGACRKNNSTKPPQEMDHNMDSALGIKVADTIIYDVIIHNENPDDAWTEQCLKGLDRISLIDNIFNLVYNSKATAFNHETGEKLTINQLKDLETKEGFNRNEIGKIQFKEAWYMDTEKAEMTKKVLSMVMGIAQYTDKGELKGYKAAFRIEMNL